MRLLALLFLLLPMVGAAQENWELKKNEGGIAVYTRKLDNERFKQIRVVCEVNGTVKQLYNVLQNVNHHKEWVYGMIDSHLITRKGADTVYYYQSVNLPWPASDRDLVVQFTFKLDNNGETLAAKGVNAENMAPKKPDFVRVPYSLGQWHATTVRNNLIKIEYTFSVDPGGSLPAWLVNMMAVKGPFNTFKNLKALIEKEK